MISASTADRFSAKNLTEQRIHAFEQRYGQQAKELAAHAAFPLTLTTDLVYCLRETFLPQCPWYAAADVLLSGLCTAVGYDLYEMETDTRRYLLHYLRDSPKFGKERIEKLADFMVAYLKHRIRVEESDRPLILGEKPHWTALACLQPGEAYEEIQQTLQQLALGEVNPKERFRLAALVESYDNFLDDFLADQGFQHILLDWADRLAEGEPIDETADLAARLVKAGFQARLIEFEVATIVFGLANADDSQQDDALRSFKFETVTVNDRGEVIRTETRQAFYFVEPLAEGVLPLEMVAIPSGEFIMGSPENEPGRWGDESPQHRVEVSPFFISKYPITQAQWRAVAKLPQQEQELSLDPASFKGDDRPVEQVSWDDAVEFCRRLSEKTGRTYRLPTEAEWEYACRADTTTPFYFGETITAELANYVGSVYQNETEGEFRRETTPVGQFPPNAFGLYDMHGNVWEWCLDHWREDYEGAPINGSAWLTDEKNARRVRHGGSWSSDPRNCRSAVRYDYNPDVRDFNIGFRVVCSTLAEGQPILTNDSTADSPTTGEGVDYTKLQDLLVAGRWREADEETWKIMLKLARQEERGYLHSDEVNHIPGTGLRSINSLWVQYSQGRFGFSMQKRVWNEVQQDWQRFIEQVGWREGTAKDYDTLTFSLDAPMGHLPFQFGTSDACWVWGCRGVGSRMDYLLSRQDL